MNIEKETDEFLGEVLTDQHQGKYLGTHQGQSESQSQGQIRSDEEKESKNIVKRSAKRQAMPMEVDDDDEEEEEEDEGSGEEARATTRHQKSGKEGKGNKRERERERERESEGIMNQSRDLISKNSIAVVPGQDVTSIVTRDGKLTKLRLGGGLKQQVSTGSSRTMRDGNKMVDESSSATMSTTSSTSTIVVATKTGRLRFASPNRWWVSCRDGGRYIPRNGDLVIGVILERLGEEYKVGIGAPAAASLELTEFDGATRRNAPNLKVGAIVYARVVQDRDLEPWLSCKAPPGAPKKDWVTGLSVYGELKSGNVFKCTQALARKLLEPNCLVLSELGKQLRFELAVGLNGKVWVNADTAPNIIVISAAIQGAGRIWESNDNKLTLKEKNKQIKSLVGEMLRTASSKRKSR